MQKSSSAILIIIGLVIIAGIAYFIFHSSSPTSPSAPATETTSGNTSSSTPATATTTTQSTPQESIGKSVEGRDIMAYHYGSGNTELLFVAGLHGGYEWNTSALAYQLTDYLSQNPSAVPANERVTVIPVVNPDGLSKVVSVNGPFTSADVTASVAETIPARYNADTVDLNRNFDCDWQPEGLWQSTKVSGGTGAFSEPESQAIKSYVEAHHPAAVIVYYSSAGGVFASNCHAGVLPETQTLTNVYAHASGYKSYASWDFYTTTGDMVNWLAKEGIPAISVLLTNHTDTEWDINKAGVDAVLTHYAQ